MAIAVPSILPLLVPHGTVPGTGFPTDVHLGQGRYMSRLDALTCRCHSPHSSPGLLGLTPHGPVHPPCLTCLSTGLGLSDGHCH